MRHSFGQDVANLAERHNGRSRPEAPNASPPEAGEIRFYKKHYAAPSHDVMVHINDCGHNKWQPARRADKACKGIAKLENGRNDWRTIHHCAQCKGGGMWKVRW